MADYDYISLTGTILPDTANILSGVQNEYLAAFGADLIVTTDTPQGVLIAAETISRNAVVRNNAALANQINPNIAGGVFLDALLALTGAERNSEVFSVAKLVTLAGVAGTIIPAGVTLQNEDGILFASVSTVTLNGLGTANVDFQALVAGPIGAPAGTLTQIVDGVLGWETATNPTDAILGSLTQSDQGARTYRKQTLAGQGMSLAEAISSALYATPNVISLTFRENVSNMVQVIDGVTMVPHSMYACVAGGTDLAVATALLNKKSGGCNYNRDAGIGVTVNVLNTTSGQVYPVSFDRPILKPVVVRVTINANTTIVDPVSAIKQAVLDYAAGLVNGETGFVIGNSVSCFEIASAIGYEVPGVYLRNVEVSLASVIVYSNAIIPIAIWEQATIDAEAITIVTV